MAKAAVFWDRDGTLIEDPGYLNDPEKVKLLPGAAEALKRLAAAGFENVITTNQSGVARGLLDEATLERIHDRIRQKLADAGARIDAIYYCPYLDGKEAVDQSYRRDSELRKPRPGMLIQASRERNLDLSASWSIGDSARDAEAGRAAGCRTILIGGGDAGAEASVQNGSADFVVGSLEEAVQIVLKHTPSSEKAEEKDARPAGGEKDDSTALLHEILSFLRMIDRRARTEDFSLAQLTGAMIQILALAALIWAIFGMNELPGTQIIRLLYALVLQLLAMTLFVVRKK